MRRVRKTTKWALVIPFVAIGLFCASQWRAALRICGINISAGSRIKIEEFVQTSEKDIGDIVVVPLPITNEGDQPLEIFGVRTNCACSGLEIKNEDGEFRRVTEAQIPPGRTLDSSLRFTVRGRPGEPMENLVAFQTNDSVRQSVIARVVVARVRGGIVSEPTAAMFGTLRVGSQATMTLLVFDTASRVRKIDRILASPAALFSVSVSDPPAHARKDVSKGRLLGIATIRADTGAAGSIDGYIDFVLSESCSGPDRIYVFGRVIQGVDVFPSELNLAKAKSADSSLSGRLLCKTEKGKCTVWRVTDRPASWIINVSVCPEDESTARVTVCIPESVKTEIDKKFQIGLEASVDGRNYSATVPVRLRKTAADG